MMSTLQKSIKTNGIAFTITNTMLRSDVGLEVSVVQSRFAAVRIQVREVAGP